LIEGESKLQSAVEEENNNNNKFHADSEVNDSFAHH